MRSKFSFLFIAVALFLHLQQAAAQEARFFRVVGPTATTIAEFRADGTLVWSNAQPGANYTIQTVTSLPWGTNWVDYAQIPTANIVNTNVLIAPKLPSGMALIPEGSFTMGDSLDGDTNALPTNITVSAFYMDVNLVTYGQWVSVYRWATHHGYSFDDAGSGKATNHPVQTVRWYDAVKWCNARSQRAGLNPVYYTDARFTKVYMHGDKNDVHPKWAADGYRLPTEAEWEKAARVGLSGKRFPRGDFISQNDANYYGNVVDYSYDWGPAGFNPLFETGQYPFTSPVGYFAANGYGLYDMAGNVAEWCWDWLAMPYGQPTSRDPTGPTTGSYRVLRGGDWTVSSCWARCASRRGGTLPDDFGLGFRCVRRH